MKKGIYNVGKGDAGIPQSTANKKVEAKITKTYRAWPEYISRDAIAKKTGKSCNELYDLESDMNEAIDQVIKWRVANLGEGYWTEALPQTIKVLLQGWDAVAISVAIKSFQTKELFELKV